MQLIKRFNPAMAVLGRTSTSIAECQTEIPVWDQQNTGSFNSSTEDIITLCQQGKLKDALRILYSTYQTDSTVYAPLLHKCAAMKALSEGRRVHVHMIKNGFVPDYYIGNHLVNMYAKCGNLENARQVFDSMYERNVVSWTAMISGYDQYGLGTEALMLFSQMVKAAAESVAGCQPNQFTLASIISACRGLGALEQGRQVHVYTMKTGFQYVVVVCNALVTMYAKCRLLKDARQVFDEMRERDHISWNSMIAGYAEHVHDEEALKLFEQMNLGGFKPDHFTLSSVLSVCASLASIGQGRDLHAHVVSSGMESDVAVGNALIDMYAKCKHIEVARDLFDKMPERDEVSWSAMIAGYVQNGNGEEAFKLFLIMLEVGVKPNHFTFASALGACASLSAMEYGEQVHGLIIKRGYESNLFVGNALVDMYVKCGSMQCGFLVFEKMPKLDIISWTSLIVGYSQRGNNHQAVKLFSQMQQMGIKPDYVTFSSILSACANLATPEQGRQIHASAMKCVPGSNVVVGSALVNMYAKCGNVKDAHRVFDSMPEQNVVSWNAMIAGYGQNGQGKEALQLFERMLEEGIKPNDATFIGVISACCHAGLVEEGRGYFSSMIHDHSIAPRADHYACMVDLFGRAGHLEEAEDFINKMSFEPDASIWGALLNACRIHPNIEIGRRAADQLFVLEPQSAGPYVLLSNIFAAAGSWDDVAKVRRMMKDRGVRKNPGCSWIEINNRVHTFVAEDRSHPQTKEIYEMLEGLAKQLESAGYVADNRSFLNDIYEH